VHHDPADPAGRRLAFGRSGEEQAAAWYRQHGYRILAQNWRSRIGEIDLVCALPEVLVFCEVKTRHNDRLGTPAEAVTARKQIRLRRLADQYVGRHTGGGHQLRFDVVAILGDRLTVIEGAF
jgi:putative endonuclease